MPRYEFQYHEDGAPLQLWIQTKIDKLVRLNAGKVGARFENLELLEPRETDMLPTRFVVYSRDPEASARFTLNPATGDISVTYASEALGNRGGNPWWCIAESRQDSSVCGEGAERITMLPAGDAHSMSIKEYLDVQIKQEIHDPVPITGGKRKSRKNRKASRKASRKAQRKASRKHRKASRKASRKH